jgi:hypothetical protein
MFNKTKILVKKYFNNKILIFDFLLILIGTIYYLFFLFKGLSLMDEGYMLHMAERITLGQIPFRDFLSQYSPGYLYLLGIFFKIFGPSIFISRIVSLLFCIGILFCVFFILNELKIKNKFIHFLAFLSIIAFGYPLLNIAIISWPIVFFSLILAILLIKSLDAKKINIYLLVGFVLSIILFFKQNIGLYYLIFTIIFIILNTKNKQKIFKELFYIAVPFIFITLLWGSISFLNNADGLLEFIKFSMNFGAKFSFSYPPLTMLSQPLGFFKLLPYYLPILFTITLIYFSFKNSLDKKLLTISLISLIGFYGYIYPASDLLHLYPFFGMVLVSILLVFTKKNIFAPIYLLIIIVVLTGFYLTLFREYFRYHPPYKFQSEKIMIGKANNIQTTKSLAISLKSSNEFIKKYTDKNEPIFVYPTYPMLYFLFDRPNPSKDSLYIKPYSMYSENVVLNEIKAANIRYIVTYGRYDYPTLLSDYIKKQKVVFSEDQIRIFYIKTK